MELNPRLRGSVCDERALDFRPISVPGVKTRWQSAIQDLSDLLESWSGKFDNDNDRWGTEHEAVARDRILRGLDDLLSLPIAQEFQQPVNVEQYRDYNRFVPYPIDLGTIKQRLDSGYYRFINNLAM